MSYESVIAGAVGFWPCQDNTASTVVVATTGSNATLVGGEDTEDIDALGPNASLPGSLLLDGSSDYISLGISRNSFSEPFAIGGWFYVLDPQTDGGSELLFGTVNEVISFAWGGNGSAPYKGTAFTSSGGYANSGGPFVHGDAAWVHLAWFWDGARLWTVRNGLKLGAGLERASLGASGNDIQVGRSANSSGRATNTRVAGLFAIETDDVADIATLHAGPQASGRRLKIRQLLQA